MHSGCNRCQTERSCVFSKRRRHQQRPRDSDWWSVLLIWKAFVCRIQLLTLRIKPEWVPLHFLQKKDDLIGSQNGFEMLWLLIPLHQSATPKRTNTPNEYLRGEELLCQLRTSLFFLDSNISLDPPGLSTLSQGSALRWAKTETAGTKKTNWHFRLHSTMQKSSWISRRVH